jgi:hypothetical protein
VAGGIGVEVAVDVAVGRAVLVGSGVLVGSDVLVGSGVFVVVGVDVDGGFGSMLPKVMKPPQHRQMSMTMVTTTMMSLPFLPVFQKAPSF